MVGPEDHRADPPTGAVGTGGHGSGDAKGPRIPRGTRARVAHHHGGHRRHRSSTVRPYWLNPSRVCSGSRQDDVARDEGGAGGVVVGRRGRRGPEVARCGNLRVWRSAKPTVPRPSTGTSTPPPAADCAALSCWWPGSTSPT